MIVPSKNQKTYGVLHTENYFSFLGFSKKVNSNKVQKVDVFLDDILIDTIVADKHIEKIEDIYELEGFGFNYVLPNEYIGQKSLISFKNNETQENLQNSPYELIDESHIEFNKLRFLNSLQNPVVEDKIKNLYCPNCIGFFATEENLEDENFIKYIKDLYNRIPNATFKAFYFNFIQKDKLKNVFTKELDRIEILVPINIYKVSKEIEIFIDRDIRIENLFIKSLIPYNKQVILITYSNTPQKLNELDRVDDKTYQALKEIGIPDTIIKKYNYKWVLSTWDGFFVDNNINYVLTENIRYCDFLIDIVELCLSNNKCKQHLRNILFIYYKIQGVFEQN